MVSFLDMTKEDISLVSIAFRNPASIYQSDALESSLNRYIIISGSAWYFKFLIDCRLHVSLNSLEFIEYVNTIWVDILNQKILCLVSSIQQTACSKNLILLVRITKCSGSQTNNNCQTCSTFHWFKRLYL